MHSAAHLCHVLPFSKDGITPRRCLIQHVIQVTHLNEMSSDSVDNVLRPHLIHTINSDRFHPKMHKSSCLNVHTSHHVSPPALPSSPLVP